MIDHELIFIVFLICDDNGNMIYRDNLTAVTLYSGHQPLRGLLAPREEPPSLLSLTLTPLRVSPHVSLDTAVMGRWLRDPIALYYRRFFRVS